LYDQARALISAFKSFRTVYIPREQNKRADALANRAMDEAGAVEQ
jgi:ribonuclease HI